ncbi:MAG TPA: DUF6299 family protein [Propionibacteriaceae bacterium]|nr:DUF6299 family protein [Propionibacteriaceae bacterium]
MRGTMRVLARLSGVAAATLIVAFGGSAVEAQVPGGMITVDDRGQFLPAGQAMISGTYSCEEDSGFAFITGNLVQPVGRLTPVRGEFITEAVCTGETETWTALVQGAGNYRGGRAVASVSLMVCPDATCVSVAETTEDVRLTR